MLSKILTIARTHVQIAYSDRGALVIMFLIPVALSAIMGLAFGESTNDIELEASQIIIINQDEGTENIAGQVNYGDTYHTVLTENDPDGLGRVLLGDLGEDVAAARQQVEDGEADAVLIIPAAFSSQVNNAEGKIDLYYNPADNIGITIILSVVEQITAQLNAGQVGQQVLLGDDQSGYWVETAIENGQLAALSDGTIEDVANVTLTKLYSGQSEAAITLNRSNVQGEIAEFDALQLFAPSMAVLFMTFTMAAGTRSILEEQANWTLQRIITTPTPRWVYMMGKLIGTYASGVLQMLILLIVTPFVALALGRDATVWGDNYLGVALVTLAIVGAATGLGLLLAAISSTPRQADGYANAVVIILAMIGGTFVPIDGVPILETISNISLNKWAIEGFTDLSTNAASVADILPNVGIMLAMTAAFFGIALVRFNRRLDV